MGFLNSAAASRKGPIDMKTVRLRNVEVGAGAPKVIAPIVADTAEGVVAKGKELSGCSLDVVEWRVDHYRDALDIPKVIDTLKALRAALGEIPILFTFRTKKEGGGQEISMDRYTALNKAAAEHGADAVDVEIFSGDDVVRENVANIHAAGKAVVGSNHEFLKTPSKADIIYRLRKAQDLGADLPKIAVMPQSKEDVLTLLAATEEMSRCYADTPILTMSMSRTGVISRLCGEVFGSAMTFGAVGQTSAPGQIDVGELVQALDIIHRAS